ncbi:MAG: cysteine hydrolase [Methyloceanibacter sp.]|nr:cysteine hydrolase [Methyloceanibacter sp.]
MQPEEETGETVTAEAQESNGSASAGMNRVEQWLQDLGEPALPVPGFRIEAGRTAILFTDPQNDFLHPNGVAFGAVAESIKENNAVANMVALMKVAVETNTPLFISPHYYFPTDHGWKFEGTLEKLMHDIRMYDRPGYLNLDGFEGSGADWLDEFKPFINHQKTIVCGAHKVFGPENNDLILQLQKQRIEKVIIAGMAANLCVEAHLRELLERGFECAVAADATAGVKLPGLDGMSAALTNFTMLSSEVLVTKDAVKRIKAAA